MRNVTRFFAFTTLLCTATFASAQVPTAAAPTPTYPAENVGAFYSAIYEPVSTWKALVWGQKCEISDVEIGDDQAMKIVNLDFLPMQLDKKYIISNDFDYLHLDVYPSKETKFRVGFQNWVPEFEIYCEFKDLKGGQWNSIDIPLNEFSWPLKNDSQERIAQIIRFGGEEATITYAPEIYISNIFAYKGEPNSVNDVKAGETEIFINPQVAENYITITTNENIAQINIYNVNGQLASSVANTEGNINISNLQAGVYVVSVKLTNGNIINSRIIKK